MKTIIAVIKKSYFIESNFDEILRPHFKEFLHKNTEYMRISTFEKYAMSNTFEQVFYSESEFQAWLVEVPSSISKIQAVKQLLVLGKYNDLITALDSDVTGEARILFDCAHQLYRNSTMVSNMAVSLGMSGEDIDNFFIDANKIYI